MPRVSTGDTGSVHPYLVARVYIEIVSERLRNDRGLLGPEYIKLLNKQVEDCLKEMGKKAL